MKTQTRCSPSTPPQLDSRPPKVRGRVLTRWPADFLPLAKLHVQDLAAYLPGSLVFLRAGELEADRVTVWEIVEVPGKGSAPPRERG